MENIRECQMEFQMEYSTMEALFTMEFPLAQDLPLRFTSHQPLAPEHLSEPPGPEPGHDTGLERQDSLTLRLTSIAYTHGLTVRQAVIGLL